MRELVDHAHLRLARQDRVDIHLFQRDAAILDRAARNHFQILDLCFGVGAAVGLDDADHHVEAALAQRVRLLQHLVGLADARRRANVNAQPRPALILDARQQRVGGGAGIGHHATIGASARDRPARD